MLRLMMCLLVLLLLWPVLQARLLLGKHSPAEHWLEAQLLMRPPLWPGLQVWLLQVEHRLMECLLVGECLLTCQLLVQILLV